MLGVVGGPGDQALGAESGHVPGRKRLDFCEHFRPQLLPDRHCHNGSELARRNGGRRLEHRYRGHCRAQPEDRRCVARDDAIVNDGGVNGGQQQDARGLHQLEDNDGGDPDRMAGQQRG